LAGEDFTGEGLLFWDLAGVGLTYDLAGEDFVGEAFTISFTAAGALVCLTADLGLESDFTAELGLRSALAADLGF